MSEQEYGQFKFLENDTIEMLLEEIAGDRNRITQETLTFER